MGRRKYKLRQGQPTGTRSASGRKRRRAEEERVEPSMGVMRKRAAYGGMGSPEDCCDALGRAHLSGLILAHVVANLPDQADPAAAAKEMLRVGRDVAWKYWRIYGFHTANALARFQPEGPSRRLDPLEEKALEDRLNNALDRVGRMGHQTRRDFDGLVIDLNPDHGPQWLDDVIFSHRAKRQAEPRDLGRLNRAMEALAALAGY
ncbi:MAG TPA: hypothetical protein VF503_12270 [Sphingobium sp.]|uniref:hypothetical protein n=1 Tax=Sphingobium sp. TaxID=1912891 RepID=UPI002ED095B6